MITGPVAWGKMRKIFLITALSTSILLSGCATDGTNGSASSIDKQAVGTVLGGILGAVAGSRIGGGNGRFVAVAAGTLLGAYVGNQIGASLDEADRLAVKKKVNEVLVSAPDGKVVKWSSPDSGSSAVLTPKDTHKEVRKVTLLRDKRVAPLPRLELIGETWQAKTNANVRAAPSLNADIVSGLKSGETFEAVAKVEGRDWIVVARGKRTIGYVASFLVRKAVDREVMARPTPPSPTNNAAPANAAAVDLDTSNLVADQVIATSTCRDMSVVIKTKNGKQEHQDIKACKAADGAWDIL